jgi:hypothetical protein
MKKQLNPHWARSSHSQISSKPAAKIAMFFAECSLQARRPPDSLTHSVQAVLVRRNNSCVHYRLNHRRSLRSALSLCNSHKLDRGIFEHVSEHPLRPKVEVDKHAAGGSMAAEAGPHPREGFAICTCPGTFRIVKILRIGRPAVRRQ